MTGQDDGVVRRAEDDYEVDYTFCKGCGICVEECPRSAMEMSTLESRHAERNEP